MTGWNCCLLPSITGLSKPAEWKYLAPWQNLPWHYLLLFQRENSSAVMCCQVNLYHSLQEMLLLLWKEQMLLAVITPFIALATGTSHHRMSTLFLYSEWMRAVSDKILRRRTDTESCCYWLVLALRYEINIDRGYGGGGERAWMCWITREKVLLFQFSNYLRNDRWGSSISALTFVW